MLFVAVVFGVELIVAGIFRLVAAVALEEGAATSRVLLAVLGLLSILAGVLCLRAPFQTVLLLGLFLGLFFVISGVVEIFQGASGDSPSPGWTVASGVLGLLAGIVVLVWPLSSLVTLTWLFGITLLVIGVMTIAAGFAQRRTAT